MKFFIDTADVKEIREAHSLGILDGVTTNPTLISKTGRPWRECVEEICSIVEGPVSVEAVSLKADEIIKEARELSRIAKNVVIKVPIVGWTQGRKGALLRRHQDQYDPMFLPQPGPTGS